MARKKKKQKQKQKIARVLQKMNRPAARLTEAHEAATQGQLANALDLAQDALRAANDADTIERSGTLASELHFRLAGQRLPLQERLRHLEEGEALTPDDPRFPFHRGVVLLVLQQPEAARQAFLRALEIAPDDPDAAMLLAFADAQAKPTATPESAPESLSLLTALARGDFSVDDLDDDGLASLPGDDSTLWRSLLAMASDPKSSRTAGLGDDRKARTASLASPLLDYYAGVAASRRNDHGSTVAAWLSVQADGLNTPWWRGNRIYLLRQSAEEAAELEQWSNVVDLLQNEPLAKDDSAMQELLGYSYFHLGTDMAEAGNWPKAAQYWRKANGLTPSRYLAQNLALAEEMTENWLAAGEAWRELLRRRPRKAEHPDYLNEAQVAIIWRRAASCYENEYDTDEAINCLTKAIEYAPNNLDWRMQLVKIYLEVESDDAAENELDRILEIDPDYMPALIELAEYYDERWYGQATPIWRRAVAADATSQEARDGLAQALIEDATHGRSSRFGHLLGFQSESTVKALEKALVELPDHPQVLFTLGRILAEEDENDKARERLIQAGRVAARSPNDNLKFLGDVMHELLHADGGEQAAELMDIVRQVPNLRADYWIDQGEHALHCALDRAWIERFWQEALDLSQSRPGQDTPALTLLKILNAIDDNEDVDEDLDATIY